MIDPAGNRFQFHKGTIKTFYSLNLPARSIISIP